MRPIDELIKLARMQSNPHWQPLCRELADALEALDKHHTIVCDDRETIWHQRDEARAEVERLREANAELRKEIGTVRMSICSRAIEIIALRRVVEAARAVSSEPDVLDLLTCYTMGTVMLDALAALEETKP